ncbi:hypothetical protein MGP2080_08479 [marine gamma proteobacterium HTCC2080]|nr:hypothetical protein MGP2080_08479 [marine gamma proteobacterium HTCC2080]
MHEKTGSDVALVIVESPSAMTLLMKMNCYYSLHPSDNYR